MAGKLLMGQKELRRVKVMKQVVQEQFSLVKKRLGPMQCDCSGAGLSAMAYPGALRRYKECLCADP
jgi:hypothetical protein